MGGRAKGTGGPCVLCGSRKSRRANGACDPCDARTKAEGTQKQLGLIFESPRRKEWRQIADDYNKLIRSGVTQKDIARLWGMNVQKLRSLVYRIKKEGGNKIVSLKYVKRDTNLAKLKPTANVDIIVRNVHGGGRWGVRGCKCDLCKAVRKATRKAFDRQYRADKKARDAQMVQV